MAYKMYGKNGDKRYYSKMQTYFVFILFWAGLALSLFGKELIRLLALNPDYWTAYQVVPYIILAYIFSGAKYIASIGLYLKRKTKYMAYTTIGAAILNVGLNFLLIPKYRMIGAAIATVISFVALYISTYLISNHFYKIPYENMKLVKMLIISLIIFFLSTLTTPLPIILRVIIKILLVISLPFILYPMKFYEPIELKRIKQGWRKLTGSNDKKYLT